MDVQSPPPIQPRQETACSGGKRTKPLLLPRRSEPSWGVFIFQSLKNGWIFIFMTTVHRRSWERLSQSSKWEKVRPDYPVVQGPTRQSHPLNPAESGPALDDNVNKFNFHASASALKCVCHSSSEWDRRDFLTCSAAALIHHVLTVMLGRRPRKKKGKTSSSGECWFWRPF